MRTALLHARLWPLLCPHAPPGSSFILARVCLVDTQLLSSAGVSPRLIPASHPVLPVERLTAQGCFLVGKIQAVGRPPFANLRKESVGTSTHQQVYRHSQDSQQFANTRCDGWSGSLPALLEPFLPGASLPELPAPLGSCWDASPSPSPAFLQLQPGQQLSEWGCELRSLSAQRCCTRSAAL